MSLKKRHLNLLNKSTKVMLAPKGPPPQLREFIFSQFNISPEDQPILDGIVEDIAFATSLAECILTEIHLDKVNNKTIKKNAEFMKQMMDMAVYTLKLYVDNHYIDIPSSAHPH